MMSITHDQVNFDRWIVTVNQIVTKIIIVFHITKYIQPLLSFVQNIHSEGGCGYDQAFMPEYPASSTHITSVGGVKDGDATSIQLQLVKLYGLMVVGLVILLVHNHGNLMQQAHI